MGAGTEGRPEPYDEYRHRWLVPGWVGGVRRPTDTDSWFLWVVGAAVAVGVLWGAWRLAVAFWWAALPLVAAAWFFADRWGRRRWAAEQARRARLKELAYGIDELDDMTWLDFEIAVRDLMRRDGIKAEHVGKPGDFSGDVVGFDPLLDETWMAQAKHYGPKNRVGSGEIQKVAGSARPVYQAGLTVVVTTNDYTRDARRFAEMAGVHLVDRDALIRWATHGLHLHEVVGLAPAGR